MAPFLLSDFDSSSKPKTSLNFEFVIQRISYPFQLCDKLEINYSFKSLMRMISRNGTIVECCDIPQKSPSGLALTHSGYTENHIFLSCPKEFMMLNFVKSLLKSGYHYNSRISQLVTLLFKENPLEQGLANCDL